MPRPESSRRSPLIALFLTVFIDLMGFGIVIPLLPIYAERGWHATPFTAGALIAVYSLMQLVFAPVWGRISDAVGRRPVLLVSLTGSVISYLLLAGAWSLETLFVARVLAGIAGANISIAQAYIADVTPPADRARGMGLIGAAFGLGMVIGPAIGGGLSLVGPRVPECFAAALCLVNLGLAAAYLPESLPPSSRRRARFRHPLAPRSLRDTIGRPRNAVPLGVFFFVTLAFAVLEGTFSLAAERSHYTAAQVGALWFYMASVAIVVQGWLVGRLVRRRSEWTLILTGAAALLVGFLLVRPTGPTPTLLFALGLVVTGQGLASPSLSSLISKTVRAPVQGEVLGISQSLSAGARVIGPAGGGFIFDRLDVHAVYLTAAVCAAVALGLTLLGRQAAGEPRADVVRVRQSG